MSSDRARPLGRPTRWSLPERDDSIDRLDEATRAHVARIWTARIETEARAIEGFTRLAEGLEAVDAEPEVVALARRAVDDEARHAGLCRRVASAYLGREVAEQPPPAFVAPTYPGAPPEIVPTLLAVSLCVMQETTSSAFIEACLRGTTAPLARAALRELFADEIDHARIGWAHLSSPRLPPEQRAAVGPWLLALGQANFRAWWPRDPAPRHEDALPVAHGCGSHALGAAAVLAATRELIAPGLARAGFLVPAFDEWVATLGDDAPPSTGST